MTVKEAAARARKKDEKDEMVALLDQLLDFLDEHLASPHLSVDTKTRQKLRPYLARMIGTAGDGRDEERTVLVRWWPDNSMEVCTRSESDAIWGPPQKLEMEAQR
jgi:hypothetical protein